MRRERLRKDGAEREDSGKNTSVLAVRAPAKRGRGMEENREESPPVESTGECASTSPLFRSTPGEPRRTPANHGVGLYRMCIYGAYMVPDPSTYGTSPLIRVWERGSDTRERILHHAVHHPHPCLSQRLFLSSRAEPHLRAIFRILPHGTSNSLGADSRISHECTKVRVVHGSYIRNWERVTFQKKKKKFHVLFRHDTRFFFACFKNFTGEISIFS